MESQHITIPYRYVEEIIRILNLEFLELSGYYIDVFNISLVYSNSLPILLIQPENINTPEEYPTYVYKLEGKYRNSPFVYSKDEYMREGLIHTGIENYINHIEQTLEAWSSLKLLSNV